MSTKTMYDLFYLEYKDAVVDTIEELHFMLCKMMPIQDADLCREYLIQHFYYDNHWGEA